MSLLDLGNLGPNPINIGLLLSDLVQCRLYLIGGQSSWTSKEQRPEGGGSRAGVDRQAGLFLQPLLTIPLSRF